VLREEKLIIKSGMFSQTFLTGDKTKKWKEILLTAEKMIGSWTVTFVEMQLENFTKNLVTCLIHFVIM
jgi:hypothetical protein